MIQQTATARTWPQFYETHRGPEYPAENLVRMLKGDYIPGFDGQGHGRQALVVGFGSGRHVRLLNDLGWRVSGSEVTEDVVGSVNLLGDLRAGTNRDLPWEGETFDLLVSWNTVHYEETLEDVERAFGEFARVMSTGARLILSTTAPGHKILDGSVFLGDRRFRLADGAGWRKGQVHTICRDTTQLWGLLGPWFSGVRAGKTKTNLFGASLNWYLATGVKSVYQD